MNDQGIRVLSVIPADSLLQMFHGHRLQLTGQGIATDGGENLTGRQNPVAAMIVSALLALHTVHGYRRGCVRANVFDLLGDGND